MITFIIPNRGGANIEFICQQLKQFYKDSAFIVMSQEDEKPFCRGQLFNIGIRDFSDSKYLCLIDNDIFFPTYVDLIRTYNDLRCIILQPFNVIQQVKLDDAETYKITSRRIMNYKEGAANPQYDYSIGYACGGITFLSRYNFKKINGFSNLYVGWGREDNEIFLRCQGEFKNITNSICHIEHPRRLNDFQKNSDLNLYYLKQRDKRNYLLDGFRDTTYELVYDKEENGIRYIGVKDIYVKEDFIYKNLLDQHYDIKN